MPRRLHAFHSELVLCRVSPGAHQDPEITGRFFAEQILAVARRFTINIPQQQIASLSQGGHQAGLVNAAVILGGEKHARVTRVQGEGQHLTPDRGNGGEQRGCGLLWIGGWGSICKPQRAQIVQQLFRVGECLVRPALPASGICADPRYPLLSALGRPH